MKRVLQWLSQFTKKLDKPLFIAVTLCASLSVVLIYSIYYNHVVSSVGASYYQTQLAAMLIGTAGCLVLTALDYHKIAKLWFLYMPLALVLVGLTFTSLGVRREGADDRAWLNLGFTTIQPSEFLKLAFILSFSYHLSRDEENINKPLHLLLLCVHAGIPTLLIFLQGDYGTAVVFIAIFAVMLFSMGLKLRYILAAFALAGGAGVVLWNFVLKSVHKNRILVLLHPGSDPLNIEYQQDRGLESLGSGQVFGKGLFGAQEYVTVPELHNDFIFAWIGQVFGFVGTVAVVCVLAYICLKVFADSRSAKDTLGKLICLGVFAMFFSHCFMNIGMVLKVMPVVGIPLPFFSAGGTAMLSMYLALGLALSVHAHNEKKYRVFYDAE